MVKFYPLLEFTQNEIWQIIDEKKIPFNRLYKQDYASIGCARLAAGQSKKEKIRGQEDGGGKIIPRRNVDCT